MLVDLRPNGNPLRTPHPLGDDFGEDLLLLFKLHETWLVAFLENRQNCCHRCQILTLKCIKIDFSRGFAPDPAGKA